MGVWDSGPTYTITELTENRLVLYPSTGGIASTRGSGYFTLIFESEGLTFSDGGSDLGICLWDNEPNADHGRWQNMKTGAAITAVKGALIHLH